MLEVAPTMARAMIAAHQRRLSECDSTKSTSLDPLTVKALRAAFAQGAVTFGTDQGEDGLPPFLARMACVVSFRSALTAKDRPNMPAGSGAVGSYPLPSPEGDADRRPTPLASDGDFWS